MASIPSGSVPPFLSPKYSNTRPIPSELSQKLVELKTCLDKGDTRGATKISTFIAKKYNFNLLNGLLSYPNVHTSTEFPEIKRKNASELQNTAAKCLGLLAEFDPKFYRTIAAEAAVKEPIHFAEDVAQAFDYDTVEIPVVMKKLPTLGYLIGELLLLLENVKIVINRLIPFSTALTIKDKIAALKHSPLFDPKLQKMLVISKEFLQEQKALVASFAENLVQTSKESKKELLKLGQEVDKALFEQLKFCLDSLHESYDRAQTKLVHDVRGFTPDIKIFTRAQKRKLEDLGEVLSSSKLDNILHSEDPKELKSAQKILKELLKAITSLSNDLRAVSKSPLLGE